MPSTKTMKIDFPKVENRSYTDYLKAVFTPLFDKSFGDIEKENSTLSATSRILINGKPMKTYVEQIDRNDPAFYNALGDAISGGARITILPQNLENGRSTEEALTLSFNMKKDVKNFLKDNVQQSRVTKAVTSNKLKEDEIIKAENTYAQQQKSIENIVFSSGYQTTSDILYKKNLLAQDLCISIYGEDSKKSPVRGNSHALTNTTIKNKDSFRMTRSGVSLAAAYLLANGMSVKDLLDPDAQREKKREAGTKVRELAEGGDEGRRKMALMAADAMKVLSDAQRSNTTPNVYEWIGNYEDYAMNQFLFDLNQEVGVSVLKLSEAYEDLLRKENAEKGLNKTEDQIKQEALEKYNKDLELSSYYELGKQAVDILSSPVSTTKLNDWTLDQLAFRQVVQEKHNTLYIDKKVDVSNFTVDINMPFTEDLNEKKMHFKNIAAAVGKEPHEVFVSSGILDNPDMNVLENYEKTAFRSFKDVINDFDKMLEKADPSYLRSSKEFKALKASVKNLKEIYARTPDEPSNSWYHALENSCREISVANQAYLKLKTGIEPKKGSNAYIRLEAAKVIDNRLQKLLPELNKFNKNMDFKEFEKTRRDFDRNHLMLTSPTSKDERAKEETNRTMELSMKVKNPENDYQIPKGSTITEADASLLTLLTVTTEKISTHFTNGQQLDDAHLKALNVTGALLDDIINKRDGFDVEKMELVELARKEMKDSMNAYASGDKTPLAKNLAEGLKTFSMAFKTFDKGITEQPTFSVLQTASNIFDMLERNKDLVELACNKDLMGDNCLTKDTLELYRAAKTTYTIALNAIDAQNTLLNMKPGEISSPESQKKIRTALADLTIKNHINKEISENNSRQDDAIAKQLQPEFDRIMNMDASSPEFRRDYNEHDRVRRLAFFSKEMSPVQKKLTPSRNEQIRNQLAESKGIKEIAEKITPFRISQIFGSEKIYFERVEKFVAQKDQLALNENAVKANRGILNDQPNPNPINLV